VGRQDTGFRVWDDINRLFTVTFHIDESGRILQCSPLVKRFFTAEDALNGSFFELFSFNRPSAFNGTYDAAKASGGKLFLGFNEAIGFAVRGQILDLSQHGLEGLCFVGVPWLWWIEANNPKADLTLADFPAHDVQMDQLFFMSAQQTMVDDLQLVNDELSLAQQKVEKLSASRVEHFRHISHEMRTPLSGIISALTLLKDKQHDDRSHELIRLANYSATRLLEVINYTLDSAALDAGESGEERETFDLNVMIDESLALVQAKALEKGIELRRAGQQYFATSYHGRPKLLRQVLSNLLGNAIKFATGGAIVVSAQVKESRSNDAEVITFSVSDEGPGIPEELQAKIFDPFTTGLTKQTESHNGTGLGLSIVKRFVETLGGAIEVESLVGLGSTFSFELPMVRAGKIDADTEQPRASSDAACRLSGSVLIVDGMQANLLLNASILETLGLNVDVASSGEEAVHKVLSSPDKFDIVFMDLDMPGIDGLEATRQILEAGTAQSLRIVALSAHNSDEDRRNAFNSGMSNFMVKPLIRDAVLGELREWLPHETSDSSNSLQSGRVSEELSVTESGQAPEILPDAQAEQALFEPLKVDALIKELGLEVVTTLVKKFLTESAERWNALERGVAAEELATISRESHTLGSSCLTFGIVGAGQRFRQIEAQVKAGETIALSALGAIEQPLVVGIQKLEARLRDEA